MLESIEWAKCKQQRRTSLPQALDNALDELVGERTEGLERLDDREGLLSDVRAALAHVDLDTGSDHAAHEVLLLAAEDAPPGHSVPPAGATGAEGFVQTSQGLWSTSPADAACAALETLCAPEATRSTPRPRS